MLPVVKICLKTDYIKKDGTVNIRIRITNRKKVKYFPLGIYIKPEHFLVNKISKKDPHHWLKTLAMNKKYEKAMKIIYDMELNDQMFSFDRFSAYFIDKNYGNQSFKSYADHLVESCSGSVSWNTTRAYKSQINKIMEFAPRLKFEGITIQFLREFETFLVNKKNNNANTRIKTLKILKAILNQAKKDGIIKDHCMSNYQLGSIQGNRQFLTLHEVQGLENLLRTDKLKRPQANVLTYFLFACHTGLRYQDMKSLSWKHIQDRSWINITMHKTKRTVRIPINSAAERLLPLCSGSIPSLRVFKVMTDQPTNRYLKEIAAIAGIDKSISFHCSRHTFATVALDCGMSIETVSKILGHTEIKTTQIYARIRDGKKLAEMKKLDDAFQIKESNDEL